MLYNPSLWARLKLCAWTLHYAHVDCHVTQLTHYHTWLERLHSQWLLAAIWLLLKVYLCSLFSFAASMEPVTGSTSCQSQDLVPFVSVSSLEMTVSLGQTTLLIPNLLTILQHWSSLLECTDTLGLIGGHYSCLWLMSNASQWLETLEQSFNSGCGFLTLDRCTCKTWCYPTALELMFEMCNHLWWKTVLSYQHCKHPAHQECVFPIPSWFKLLKVPWIRWKSDRKSVV